MSMKVSIDHGGGHHLYAQMFKPEKVYLSLDGVEFAASPGGVTVAIPAEVWERIRAHGIGEFREWWDDDDPGPETPPETQ